jgi:hypothetical protein
MFATEPIVVLFTLYLTIVYIVLFTFLTGFEFIFSEVFKFGKGVTFLCFLGLGIGFFGAGALVPFLHKKYDRDLRKAQAEGRSGLPPEQSLFFCYGRCACHPHRTFLDGMDGLLKYQSLVGHRKHGGHRLWNHGYLHFDISVFDRLVRVTRC